MADPDTLYHHQVMRQPDREDFKATINKEIKDQINNNNFTVLHRKSLPPSMLIIPTVQQMKCTRDTQSGKLIKYKATLTVDRSKMKKGVHFEETYSSVAN